MGINFAEGHGHMTLYSATGEIDDSFEDKLPACPNAFTAENACLGILVGQFASESRLGNPACLQRYTV